MPEDTVYITDIETEILRVFVERKIFDNKTILAALVALEAKLLK